MEHGVIVTRMQLAFFDLRLPVPRHSFFGWRQLQQLIGGKAQE
jgi:hypothetical protein